MPTLECLHEKVNKLEILQECHEQQLSTFAKELASNTLLTMDAVKHTKETFKNTEEIVELLKWGRTTRKVIIWCGSFLGGLWAIVEAVRHFKIGS